MSIIEAVGLTKSFGAVTALDGLDLTVTAGRVCALLGPNGAGKTTAIRILATLTRPDGGRASVAGHDVLRQPGQVRAAIALAGQHAAVDDDLTGRENLVILGLMHHLGRRQARQRAAALLTEFGLADAADRLVKTWSGGMRRRLDVVGSLILSPHPPASCCSWTSRPPAWTRAAGPRSGPPSGGWPRPAPRCCCRPST